MQYLLLIWLLLFSTAGFAKKLYKYQDGEGRWYFTDKLPEGQRPVEIRQLKPAPQKRVWLEERDDPGSTAFYLVNQYPGAVEVEVDWVQSGGLSSNPELPHRFVVGPGKSDILFTVSASAPSYSKTFKLEYSYVAGPPLPDYVGQALYLPPLPPGSRFLVTQGFNGEFSHTDSQNRYAVDIMMPVGTPVHAARAGTVLEVDNDYFESGMHKAYASRANSIRILHDDGSIAVYAHLALERAQVHSGLRVQAGELIGYSGNTGFSSGPHLHFAVEVNRGMELVSVPFLFAGQHGQAIEPREGEWLDGISLRVDGAGDHGQQSQYTK